MEPKGSNLSHKGTQMSLKGAKGLPKVRPKSIKMTPRVATPKKVDLGGARVTKFWPIIGVILGSKLRPKIDAKLSTEKTLKKHKINPKTSHDFNP